MIQSRISFSFPCVMYLVFWVGYDDDSGIIILVSNDFVILLLLMDRLVDHYLLEAFNFLVCELNFS